MPEYDEVLALVKDPVIANNVMAWVRKRDQEFLDNLDLHADWLVIRVKECTCAGGTPESSYIHEGHCGMSPLTDWGEKINAVRGDTIEEVATLFDSRKPNGQVYQGYDVARELNERAAAARRER